MFRRCWLLIVVALCLRIGVAVGSGFVNEDFYITQRYAYIGYFSGVRVLDTVGLVTPKVLFAYRRGELSPWLRQIERFAPAWVVLRPGEREKLERAAAAEGTPWPELYTLDRTFSYQPSTEREPVVFTLWHRR